MPKIQIAIINEYEAGVSNDAVQAAVNAMQKQVSEHFSPVWGVDADVIFYPAKNPPPGTWLVIILDDTDQANALGYHDLTAEGLPIGKAFAGTDIRGGYSWTVTLSHEILEMLADPSINLCVLTSIENQAALYAYEVCDACNEDHYGYQIEGVLVSDFLFPSWFQFFENRQFDFMNYIDSYFKILPGCATSINYVNSGQGWQLVYADAATRRADMRAHVGSRRERRRIPKSDWLKSNN